MGDWKEYCLGNCVESISETYRFSEKEEVVFLNTSDIYLGQVLSREYQNSANLPGQAKKKIKKGDILFSEIRPANGRFAKIDFEAEKYVVSTKLMVLRCNDKIDTDFFFIFLTSKETLNYLQMVAEDRSATFPQITFENIANINVLLPSKREQRVIAEVLSSLDDKIDLLHRQNKTLEALAETLFRQWFVEGAEESWEYCELGEEIRTTSGGTPSRNDLSYYINGSLPWVKSKELNGGFILDTEEKITHAALENSSAKILPTNSILVAMYGATVGEYGILAKEMTCNQAVCAILPNIKYPYTFIFLYIKSNKEALINMAVGSAQQNISQVLIQKLLIPKCYEKISLFHLTMNPFFEKILANTKQIQHLTKLRDTLLPKLMSGEVRVKSV